MTKKKKITECLCCGVCFLSLALVKPCEVHKGVSGVQITGILYNETL